MQIKFNQKKKKCKTNGYVKTSWGVVISPNDLQVKFLLLRTVYKREREILYMGKEKKPNKKIYVSD